MGVAVPMQSGQSGQSGQSAQSDSHHRLPVFLRRWINDGGEPHPVENALAFLVLALGVTSLVCLGFEAWNFAAWIGIVGGLVAVYDEFISKTLGERRLILVGFVLCIVCLAIAMAQGALF
jgi:hypothetical protein